MKRALVKYICNGFMVQMSGATPGDPTFVLKYAQTVAEAVYWLAEFFEPPPLGDAPVLPTSGAPTDRTLKSTDTLMNQEATIVPVDGGGYLVRQPLLPAAPGAR
jgi:hypothetical protein